MMTDFYIYGLANSDGEVCYVGVTRNLARRYREHLRPSSYISSCISQPILVLLDVVDDFEWREVERWYIDFFRSRGVVLFNRHRGGGGWDSFGRKLTTEHKQKISALGRRHSVETIQKMSKQRLGKKKPNRTPEQCAAISKRMTGRKLSEAHRENIRRARFGSHFDSENRTWIFE